MFSNSYFETTSALSRRPRFGSTLSPVLHLPTILTPAVHVLRGEHGPASEKNQRSSDGHYRRVVRHRVNDRPHGRPARARLVLAARNEEALRALTDEIVSAGGEATYSVAGPAPHCRPAASNLELRAVSGMVSSGRYRTRTCDLVRVGLLNSIAVGHEIPYNYRHFSISVAVCKPCEVIRENMGKSGISAHARKIPRRKSRLRWPDGCGE